MTQKHPQPMKFSGWNDMPHSTYALATMEWNETGTWRYMRPKYVERVPPCQSTCPTANDIEAWIGLLEAGKTAEAWEAASMESAFPSVMGRVCFHPCMGKGACNRNELGGAVNIQMIEMCLGDAMGEKPPAPKPFFKPSGKKVAVVGAGPAGLSASYHLLRLGHHVTVFERHPQAGGMLRYGIPAYRLPRKVLDREIDKLTRMGLELKLGKPIANAAQMQDLRREFNAIFLGTGAHKSKAMGIEAEKSQGVMTGLEFLRLVSSGKPPHIGKKVVVVGGGNTAVDTARSAKRLGIEVTILYRRTRAEMPAFREEVDDALAEGVVLSELSLPRKVILKNGRLAGLECIKMRLGEPDDSGRRRPEPIPASEFTADADTVLSAIGEDIDSSIIPSTLHIENGALKTGPDGRTGWANVFAGGDLTSIPRTVVDACGSGKRAAIAIDCLFRGESSENIMEQIKAGDSVQMALYLKHIEKKTPADAQTKGERQNRVVRFEELNTVYFTDSKPAEKPLLTVEMRFRGDLFPEVRGAPTTDARNSELARCLHCGRCTECDNCYIYCPDVAIEKKQGGFEIDYFFCKGCGVCAKECPRSAMEMVEEPMET